MGTKNNAKWKCRDPILQNRWRSMISRCQNPKNSGFHNYGGRGIGVCAAWAKDFDVFADWALANGYRRELSLDRIDVNGEYGPSNCRFADVRQQARNRRKLDPFKHTRRVDAPRGRRRTAIRNIDHADLNDVARKTELTLLGRLFRLRDGKRTWTAGVYRCSCGRIAVLQARKVGKDWFTCGQGHRRQGQRLTRRYRHLYAVWLGMKQRCTNPRNQGWNLYGARGISVCEEWTGSFERFLRWSLASGYCQGVSIDRIDVNGNYDPENCRWASAAEQSNNKRRRDRDNTSRGFIRLVELEGIEKPITHWLKDRSVCAVDPHTVYRRLKRGWNERDAITVSYEEEKRCRIARQEPVDAVAS